MTVISYGGKVVAFSAVKSIDVSNGPGSAENDESSEKSTGTPMLVQVSLVTTVASPMSVVDYEKLIMYIIKAKDDIKLLIKKGKDFYEKYRIGPAMKAIGGLAQIVSGIKKFLPEKDDPMVENLAGLEKDIKELGEKLTDNFNELKAFISEQSFFNKIMSPTLVLFKHMRNCIRYPGDDAKNNFRKAYEANTPLTLQYDLCSYLSHDSTNPLRLSMDAERGKTKATFYKWEDIISRLMAQFIILEAFAEGLLGSKSETNLDRFTTASDEIFTKIDTWKEEYKKDQGYWEEMKKFLEPYILNSAHLENWQRYPEVMKKLESYLTNDSFCVVIMKEGYWKDEYFYFCYNENDQIIGVWKKGKCSCFIYRSHSTPNQEAFDSVVRKMTENGKLNWHGSIENTVKNELVEKRKLAGNGFIGLFNRHTNPIIAWVKSTDLEHYYPGFQTTVIVDHGLGMVMTAFVGI